MTDELEEMWKEMHFISIDLFMSGKRTADKRDMQIRYNVILRRVHVTVVTEEKK
jgi:hypothetical protein